MTPKQTPRREPEEIPLEHDAATWDEDTFDSAWDDEEAKLRALEQEAERLGIELGATLAVGDGANDLAMIEAAGLGVAYRAKPIVAARADAQVNHTDLTSLLYFQGYGADQFA